MQCCIAVVGWQGFVNLTGVMYGATRLTIYSIPCQNHWHGFKRWNISPRDMTSWSHYLVTWQDIVITLSRHVTWHSHHTSRHATWPDYRHVTWARDHTSCHVTWPRDLTLPTRDMSAWSHIVSRDMTSWSYITDTWYARVITHRVTWHDLVILHYRHVTWARDHTSHIVAWARHEISHHMNYDTTYIMYKLIITWIIHQNVRLKTVLLHVHV